MHAHCPARRASVATLLPDVRAAPGLVPFAQARLGSRQESAELNGTQACSEVPEELSWVHRPMLVLRTRVGRRTRPTRPMANRHLLPVCPCIATMTAAGHRLQARQSRQWRVHCLESCVPCFHSLRGCCLSPRQKLLPPEQRWPIQSRAPPQSEPFRLLPSGQCWPGSQREIASRQFVRIRRQGRSKVLHPLLPGPLPVGYWKKRPCYPRGQLMFAVVVRRVTKSGWTV